MRPGLAIGQGFFALGQPAAHQLTQNRELLWGTQTFTMHYAHTALAVMQASGQESGEQLASFVAVQSVQVDFILNDPASTPQVAQDILGQACSQVVRFIATFQAILQANVAVQAFMQRGSFVGDMLQRAGRRRASAVLDEIGRGQRLDAGHGGTKHRVLRIERFALVPIY